MNKKYIILLIILLAVVLSGCKEKKEIDSGDTDNKVSADLMGRFTERKIEFPEEIEEVLDIKIEKTGIVKVAFRSKTERLFLYESEDNCKTWSNKVEYGDFLPKDYIFASACITNDGKVIVSTGKKEDPVKYMEMSAVGEYKYFQLGQKNNKAEIKELKFKLPKPKKGFLERGYGLMNLKVGDNGLLYAAVGTKIGKYGYDNYNLTCFDMNNNKMIWTFDMQWRDFEICDDGVYFEHGYEENTEILILDAKTGEEVKVIDLGFRIDDVKLEPEEDRFYYVNEEGIGISDYNRVATEQLVDAKNYSFPVYFAIDGLYYINESNFIVIMDDNEKHLFYYEYDKELPTINENELVLYSLNDNSFMQELINDFRLEHQDIALKHVVGLSEDTEESVSDAINKLNTELLAGKGPDVIILDGLPWKSYQEQNVLLDLSKDINYDDLYENILSNFKTQGKQFVVPLSITIPMYIGKDERIKEVDTVRELSDLSNEMDSPPPFYSEDEQNFIFNFMPTYYSSIINDDASVNSKSVQEMLIEIKNLADVLASKKGAMYYNTGEDWDYDTAKSQSLKNIENTNFFGNELYVPEAYSESAVFAMGDLASIYIYRELDTFNYSFREISEGSFRADNKVGVNTSSKKKDLAKEFISFVTGKKEQIKLFQYDYGLPVNKQAFKESTKLPSQTEIDDIQEEYNSSKLDVKLKWPDKKYFDKLEHIIMELDTYLLDDKMIYRTVYREAIPYLFNEKGLEKTVKDIKSKLDIYLSE
jgi:ABC-type glycerol-3-phosphate transport system substrate-binding protein/outer membrane protein assembly factor BamB